MCPDINSSCNQGPQWYRFPDAGPDPQAWVAESRSFAASVAAGTWVFRMPSCPFRSWTLGVCLLFTLLTAALSCFRWSWLGPSCWVAVGGKGKGSWLESKLRGHETSFLFPPFFSSLVLSMLHNPLGSVLGKPPLSFLPLDPLGSDLVDKFPAPSVRGSRLDTRPILDSRSSSPSDSDTSGFSSGSDHLSDLIVCNLLQSGSGRARELEVGCMSTRMQAARWHDGRCGDMYRTFHPRQNRGCLVYPLYALSSTFQDLT